MILNMYIVLFIHKSKSALERPIGISSPLYRWEENERLNPSITQLDITAELEIELS